MLQGGPQTSDNSSLHSEEGATALSHRNPITQSRQSLVATGEAVGEAPEAENSSAEGEGTKSSRDSEGQERSSAFRAPANG